MIGPAFLDNQINRVGLTHFSSTALRSKHVDRGIAHWGLFLGLLIHQKKFPV